MAVLCNRFLERGILSDRFAVESYDGVFKPLTLEDADVLQPLFEQCTDFFVLAEGLPPSPTAAREEFNDVPEGKTPEDVYAFGLFDERHTLIGTIIGVQQYPDAETWWIGLMLLVPSQRGQGLGTKFYQAFEQWAIAQGVSKLALCVIAANQPGLEFWQRMGFEVIRKTPPQRYKVKTHEVYVLSRAIS